MEMNMTEFSRRVLEAAQEAGVNPAEICYTENERFSVRVRLGEMEDYQVSSRISAVLRGRVGEKIGTASTQALDEESIRMLIEGVKDSAALVETDEQEEILPPDEQYETVVNFRPELEDVTARQKIERAMEIDALMQKADPRITPGHTVVASGSGMICLKNTLGLDLTHRSNMIYAYTSAVAKEGEHTVSGSKLLWGYDLADIDAAQISGGCAEDALAQLGAGRIASGSYPVVLKNTVMADLLSTFSGIFSADHAQKGMSLLAGKEGTPIANACVTLTDDPLMPWGMGSAPFDREGAASRTKQVIRDGVLTTLLHNRKTAEKAGVQTTGNAGGGGTTSPTNFYICPGSASLNELLEAMDSGLYITEVSGLHAGANAVSGDFSLIARGFEVSGGKPVRAIEQFTVAGNFYRLLMQICAVGSDLLFEGTSVGSPCVRVESLSIAGE